MAYKRARLDIVSCTGCSKKFLPNWVGTKYCSDDCRKMVAREKTGVSFMDKFPKMKKSSVWKLSEILVAVDLMSKGFDVFMAYSPSTYCDLIAKKPGGNLLEVEVRTGYQADGGKISFGKGLRDSANTYGVFIRNSSTIEYLDASYNKIEL